jgi:bifunctional non-homologous end joining protein LigD
MSKDRKGAAGEPHFVAPMKARLASTLPKPNGWVYEVKFDGIRAIAVKNGSKINLFSRKPRDITGEYPEIADALKKLPAKKFVGDGEIVALDEEGRSSFQLLQNRRQDREVRKRICYYLFDLLHLDGRALENLSLIERKEELANLLHDPGGKLRFSSNLEGPPKKIWRKVQQLRLEGLVAKQSDSTYEPDRRSGAWLKIKAIAQQEFVIGGYTAPKGARSHFGAILIGYYRQGKLVFASKVGTGFDVKHLESLHKTFAQLKTDVCPFSKDIADLGASELRRCTWLKPQLACEVKFAEWTNEGKLRQPVFLGLRDDKKATEVVRESPAP